MTALPALEVRNLAVGWEARVVAEIDELILSPGQITVLAGPNGAGKSTAIKTVARQIKPLSGSVTTGGANALTLDWRQFAQQIAYVPQLLETPKSLTVDETVMLGRNAHQAWWSWEVSPRDREAVENALTQTETTHLRTRKMAELSGGERQRVALAMALAQQTPVLLLDEPTAHLDFKHQIQLVSLLRRLKGQGIAVLLVLHDLNLIARVADNVVLLEKPGSEAPSRVAASGASEAVLTEEVLKRVYDVVVAITHDAASGVTSYVPISID